MENVPASEARAWVETQVPRFGKARPAFDLFARTLTDIFNRATKRLAPLAIVQARAKTIPSFAEKIIRKLHRYKDPLVDMTDLCGARVIVHTAEQVQAVCGFIEEHFTIDWDNSADVSQRLRPTEFGYRSVHYIISITPGVFPTKQIEVAIDPSLLEGLPQAIFPDAGSVHPFKAEIQVRTILEHAWADISHDMAYKSEIKVPAKFSRDFAAIMAVLEGADREFARIHTDLAAYSAESGKYLSREEIAREIKDLELILRYDEQNVDLAMRIATLSAAMADWGKIVELLTPFQSIEHQPASRALAAAGCHFHADRPESKEFKQFRERLDQATRPPHKDAEGVCALADAWAKEDEDIARKHYRRAFELDPTHPVCLSKYLEYEILCQRKSEIISLIAPTITAACNRCHKQIEAGVNLPGAYLHLAKFHLLLGNPTECLAKLAKAVDLSPPAFMIAEASESLKRLRVIRRELDAYDCMSRLLLIAQATRYPGDFPDAIVKIRELAIADRPPIEGPAIIVAGGCSPSVEDQVRGYRDMLVDAFNDFKGTILSGGTIQGISGLVGDLREHHGASIRTIGYLPQSVPADATIDRNTKRYSELRYSDGSKFSPLEPLQNWIDLVAAGIAPSDIKVLGINGGSIASVEYRIAAALGARVALLDQSGREAAKIFSDPDWEDSKQLLSIPADAMTLRAFMLAGNTSLGESVCELVAKEVHETYRRNEGMNPSTNPSMCEWEKLPETLKNSNRSQANHILAKLHEIGCATGPLADGALPDFEFSDEEIERLADMEHGRWNVERLMGGWRYGDTKDVERKTNPALVPWQLLPESVREWDRKAVREIPALLALAGLRIVREAAAAP